MRRTSSEDLPTAASPAWKARVRIGEGSYVGTPTGNDKLQDVMPCNSGHSQLGQNSTESGSEIQQAVGMMQGYRNASTGGGTAKTSREEIVVGVVAPRWLSGRCAPAETQRTRQCDGDAVAR